MGPYSAYLNMLTFSAKTYVDMLHLFDEYIPYWLFWLVASFCCDCSVLEFACLTVWYARAHHISGLWQYFQGIFTHRTVILDLSQVVMLDNAVCFTCITIWLDERPELLDCSSMMLAIHSKHPKGFWTQTGTVHASGDIHLSVAPAQFLAVRQTWRVSSHQTVFSLFYLAFWIPNCLALCLLFSDSLRCLKDGHFRHTCRIGTTDTFAEENYNVDSICFQQLTV